MALVALSALSLVLSLALSLVLSLALSLVLSLALSLVLTICSPFALPQTPTQRRGPQSTRREHKAKHALWDVHKKSFNCIDDIVHVACTSPSRTHNCPALSAKHDCLTTLVKRRRAFPSHRRTRRRTRRRARRQSGLHSLLWRQGRCFGGPCGPLSWWGRYLGRHLGRHLGCHLGFRWHNFASICGL